MLKGSLVAGLLATALWLAPNALAADLCPPGETVAAVYLSVENEAEHGRYGNEWATSAFTEKLVVVRTGFLTYCATTNASGQFTTIAGISPAATGRVRSGISGTRTARWRSTSFTGLWNPKVATTGDIGTYDFDDAHTDWTSLYFDDVFGYGLATWAEAFVTSSNGLWVTRDFGSAGDITGKS
jgi:hypothetical protein